MMDPTNVLATQGVTVLLIPFIVRWLKKSRFCPWLSAQTDRLNRAVSWGLGIMVAMGVHYQADLQMDQSQLHLVFDWTAVTWDSIEHTLAILGGQLSGQELVTSHLRGMDSLYVLAKAVDTGQGQEKA